MSHSFRENRNTFYVQYIFFSLWKSCRLWDNVEEYCTARHATDDDIVWLMHFSCPGTEATDTHSEYVIRIAFPPQQRSRECASMLRSTYEGWNFNFGNAAVTFDTARIQSSYFHRPSMYSPKLCRTRSQR